MPALFGALVVNRDDVEFGGDLGRLKLLPEQRVEVIDLGALRVASCERPGEPVRAARSPRTGAVLILKGIVDPSADALLARIEADGREAAVALPGHYAAILWEPALERLSIVTDLLGLYPIYVHAAPGALLFGTDTRLFERLRGFRRESDPRAIVELLRVEYLLGDHAMVRGVTLVPGGSILEARRGGAPSVRRVRDPFRERRVEARSPEEAVAVIHAAYDRAFARAARAAAAGSRGARGGEAAPLIVPLSGGKDSRTVLFEWLRADPCARSRVRAISLGAPEHWDARCARRVAAEARVPWRLAPLDPALHERWLDRFVALLDGASNVYATWWAAILEAAPLDPRATVATGFLGDALSGGHLKLFQPAYQRPDAPVEFDPGVEFALAWLERRAWSRDALARVLRRDVADAWLDAPAWALREHYHALAGAPRHVRMMRSDLENRQRRFIASQLQLYRQRMRVAAPFSDPEVIAAFLALREEDLRSQRAYGAAFAARHPRAARIMEASTRRPFHGGPGARLLCGAEVLLLRAGERLASRLLGRPWPRRDFLSFRHVYRTDIARDLEPLDRYFEPDALRREIAADGAGSNRLRLLHTLRAWLRGESSDVRLATAGDPLEA